MRIALVIHGLPPEHLSGVEVHGAALARAWVRAGAAVELLVPRHSPDLHPFAARREERWGLGVTVLNADPEGQADDGAFAAFLERERPEVVHFAHLDRFGEGAERWIQLARSRGILTSYTAQDVFPLCPRTDMLSPTGEPYEPGSWEAEPLLAEMSEWLVIWDSATAMLEDLSRMEEGRTRQIYPAPTIDRKIIEATVWGLDRSLDLRLQVAASRWRANLSARWRAFAAVDLCLATSETLRQRLEAGLGRPVRRIEAGIELREVVRGRYLGKPRLLFIGTLMFHKGLHVLLEAFDPLCAELHLCVYGASSDGDYMLEQWMHAQELGVDWMGPFEPQELPEVLAQGDVLVLPSVWEETAPFVIREAFSAGLPVLAARTRSLQESVREGVDGLFFEQGDAESLRAVLERVAREPGLLGELAQGIRPPRGIEAEAAELLALYNKELKLRAGEGEGQTEEKAPSPELPPHLQPIAEQHAAMLAMPTRELSQRVFEGLERLARAHGIEKSAAQWCSEALALGGRASDALEDASRAANWRASEAAEQERVRASLEAELRWREGRDADRTSYLEDCLGRLSEAERALADCRKHRDWALGEREALRAEADWRARQGRAEEEARGALQAEAAWLRESLAAAREEAQALQETVRGATRERRELGAHLASLEQDSAALRAHADWLAEEWRGLGERLDAGPQSGPEEGQGDAQMPQWIEGARARLEELLAELQWRRTRMRELRGARARWRLLLRPERLEEGPAMDGGGEPV